MTNPTVPTVEITPPNAGVRSIIIRRSSSTIRFAVIPSMDTSVENIAAGIRGALADAFHAGQAEVEAEDDRELDALRQAKRPVCDECGGSGIQSGHDCPHCNGTGVLQ